MVWYSHLFKNFPQLVVIHTVKGFSVVSEAEVDFFPEFPCFPLYYIRNLKKDIVSRRTRDYQRQTGLFRATRTFRSEKYNYSKYKLNEYVNQ